MKTGISIAWLYPDLMSTYGDRGNVIVLQKRCLMRGIEASVIPVTLETALSKLKSCDLIFMGGAQDRQQKLASADYLGKKAPVLKKMIDSGIPALFVCAAYQFAGHYYRPYQGDDIPGAGIFDIATEHPGDQAKRCIGNVSAKITGISDLRGTEIVGFENHGGRTRLGSAMRPLASVTHGYGNNGEDGFEGAVYKNAVGSYFHGPLLPKNPALADWLITKALEMKTGKQAVLEPLDDTLAEKAKQYIIGKFR